MQIIPAIDIKDGHCVRLQQGDMQSVTVFSEDPAAMAQHWLEQGAQRLHIVDLNGAVAGKPKNEPSIREIVSVIGEEIPVQLGGGIRDLDTIERYLDDGISYRHHRHRRGQEPGLPARRVLGVSGPHPGRPRRAGRQGRHRRLVEDDRPRRRRPRAQVRGLRRRRHHLHRHRPRRHAVGRQHRGDRQARARDQGAGHRLRRPVVDRRHRAPRASTRSTASSAPSPAARSTKARSTSRTR